MDAPAEVPIRLSGSAALKWASEEVHAKATARVVAVYPGRYSEWIEWPFGRFVELSIRLSSEGFQIVRVGDINAMEIPCRFDIRGESVDRTAAVLFGCCLYVGIEGAMMQLALSQGLSCVTLTREMSVEDALAKVHELKGSEVVEGGP